MCNPWGVPTITQGQTLAIGEKHLFSMEKTRPVSLCSCMFVPFLTHLNAVPLCEILLCHFCSCCFVVSVTLNDALWLITLLHNCLRNHQDSGHFSAVLVSAVRANDTNRQ